MNSIMNENIAMMCGKKMFSGLAKDLCEQASVRHLETIDLQI